MKKIILCLGIAVLSNTTATSQSRVVLIEQFTNSSCPPCAAASPSVFMFADGRPADVAVVSYHTLFPYTNDSMHFENPTESTQRVNYYNVTGVPYSAMDGNIFNGPTGTFISNISTHVSNRMAVTPRYQVNALSLSLTGNQLSGSFRFTSSNATNATDNLIAHVVVIEKNVLKSAYAATPGVNNETQYGYVMRKMIPDALGTTLVNNGLNGTTDIPLSWTLSHIKNKAELRVVAFVQNMATKEIYQAQLFTISNISVGLGENNATDFQSIIYPNPTTNTVSISFKNEQRVHSIKITNQLGALVYSNSPELTTDLVSIDPGLEDGVYYITIASEKGNSTQKLVVLK